LGKQASPEKEKENSTEKSEAAKDISRKDSETTKDGPNSQNEPNPGDVR
jgi:hypothetical protein